MILDETQLFLGVDGGGSKTDALLVDATGQVRGVGRGGGANYHVLGLEKVGASIQEAVGSAVQDQPPSHVCYCMTAADMPHDFATLRSRLEPLHPDIPLILHNDMMAIFRAGSRFPYGVGVVCGTGFNAGGLGKDGREVRFPALGPITGDCAGGSHLSIRALGAAFRGWDGRGEATQLGAAILAELGVPDMETLAEHYVQGQIAYEQLRRFSPLVFEVSEQGDAVAQGLIREQGTELGVAATTILRRLELLQEDCDVVLGGKMSYGKGNLLLDTVRDIVTAAAPYASVKRLEVSPVVGAVLLAADQAGVVTEGNFVATLLASLPKHLCKDGDVE